MGLEDILKGIDEKVKAEVARIKQEAEEEKEKIIDDALKRAELQKERIISAGKKEIDGEMRRKLIQVRREEKRKTLDLKKKIMDEVFQEAKEKILTINSDEYLSLMKQIIFNNLNQGDEEIIFSPRDSKIIDREFVKEVEEFVRSKGKTPKLKFLPELDDNERGFIIRSKDVQINCTVSSLFSALKDKIEIKVARILFP